MSITSTLFPPANREAALVAFLRTFWQVIRPPIVLGSLGLYTISATGVVHIGIQTVGIIAAASVLFAIVSGLLAAGDILKNGLPDAYQNAAAASIPAAVLSTVPLVTPADPSQPAAGVPPAAVALASDASAIPVQVPVAPVQPAAAPAPAVAQPAAAGDVTALPPVTA